MTEFRRVLFRSCGLPLRTEYQAYSSRFNEPVCPGSKYTLYRLSQDGFLICWMHDHAYATFGLTAGIEAMALKDISKKAACAIQFEPRLVGCYVPYFQCEPTIFRDTLDNKLYPRSGSLTLLSAKIMVPLDLPDAFLAKILVEYSCFFPLDPVVCAVRVRGGYIFRESFERIMPSERFYLGGAFSMRGYDTNLVPPLNELACGKKNIFVAIGGKSMFNINTEVRFPLYKALHGVLFVDVGRLAQDYFSDIYLHAPAVDAGFGLRYHTAVGPIRFDIGWKLGRHVCLRDYAWFLTFGQIF